MRFSRRDVAVFATASACFFACGPEPQAPAAIPVRRPEPPPIETVLRGRLAEAPDAKLLATARALLDGGGRVESCGPYPLYTDVTDARLIAACARLAEPLDDVYTARYGLRPRGKPASAIVLFARTESYRAFAREGGVPMGYAGYALAARGLAIFHADGDAASGDSHHHGHTTPSDGFATTLVHELTHLVNRRALGVNLPPWLSEGLADGIGDTATAQGFRPLDSVSGVEALAERLRQARSSDRAGNLERLVTLQRGEFDRGVVSFDYEQSALLVRFLLSDRQLAAGFRHFLSDFANSEPYDPTRLAEDLGSDWQELDRRFEQWLQNPS